MLSLRIASQRFLTGGVKMLNRMLMILLLVLLSFSLACQGPPGPQGPTEEQAKVKLYNYLVERARYWDKERDPFIREGFFTN